MTTFIAAYHKGDPVCAVRDDGLTFTVVGFIWLPNIGISFSDDGRLLDQPGHPPFHHLTGDVFQEVEGGLYSNGWLFREIDQDETDLVEAWNDVSKKVTDWMAVHDDVEFDLRVDRIMQEE